jgi:5-methylcytosine-specific restriction enzyme subunit McrC
LISPSGDTPIRPGDRQVGRIPVRNLWLLMLYASELTQFRGAFDAIVEDDIRDIPELIARLLVHAYVEVLPEAIIITKKRLPAFEVG